MVHDPRFDCGGHEKRNDISWGDGVTGMVTTKVFDKFAMSTPFFVDMGKTCI